MINGIGYFAENRLLNTINRGFANKQTLNDIFLDIIGTSDNNYKDGIFVAIDIANTTIAETLIQNITSIVAASVFSTLFNKYQWISVMDSRTSNICIERNLQVYIYGSGPLPPAPGLRLGF
jgi:hypothetical protein